MNENKLTLAEEKRNSMFLGALFGFLFGAFLASIIIAMYLIKI